MEARVLRPQPRCLYATDLAGAVRATFSPGFLARELDDVLSCRRAALSKGHRASTGLERSTTGCRRAARHRCGATAILQYRISPGARRPHRRGIRQATPVAVGRVFPLREHRLAAPRVRARA